MLEFEPLGTHDEFAACLRRDHSIDSACNVGERMAAIVCSSTMAEVRQIAAKLDATPADDAMNFVEYLINTEEALNARLEIVRTAIARLAEVGNERRQASADHR